MTDGEPQSRRSRRSIVLRFAGAVGIVAILFLSVAITLSWASLSDDATTDDVSITGGSVRPPTTLQAAVVSGRPRVTWKPPTIDLVPDAYDVERRTVPGSWPSQSVARVTGTSYDDTTAVPCSVYEYRVTSRHVNLVSIPSLPVQLAFDVTPPVLEESIMVRTAAPQLAGVVAPGDQVYVYANLRDNCSTDAQTTATMRLASGTALSATLGTYTPVAGGPTYEFRAGPFTVPVLADGSSLAWFVTPRDQFGNQATWDGAPAKVDAAGPAATREPKLVSSITNYYAPETGYTSTKDSSPLDRYFVYADLTDVSGVQTVTSNVSTVTKGLTNLPLVSGSFGTDNGLGWNWRSAETTNTEGKAQRAIGVTATDRLGNVSNFSTSTFIENVAPKVATCTSANGGNGALLDNGDTTTVTFDQDLDPASLVPGWTGLAPVAITATVANGAKDTITYTGTNFIVRFELAGDWTAVGATFPTSTLTRTTSRQFQIRYGGLATGTVTQMNTGGAAFFAGSITDVAAISLRGNPTDVQQENCGTDF